MALFTKDKVAVSKIAVRSLRLIASGVVRGAAIVRAV
jgi:hypothetical protein